MKLYRITGIDGKTILLNPDFIAAVRPTDNNDYHYEILLSGGHVINVDYTEWNSFRVRVTPE